MPYVAISADEWKMACQVALDRQSGAIKGGLKDSVNKKVNWVDDLKYHMIGAIGEMAVAKSLGLSFTGSVGTFNSVSDLGNKIEVRCRSNPEWDLIVRDRDKDDAIYVLVRGLPPAAMEICGWIKGSDAKDPKWIRTYGNLRPAHFIPASALHSMEELKSANV